MTAEGPPARSQSVAPFGFGAGPGSAMTSFSSALNFVVGLLKLEMLGFMRRYPLRALNRVVNRFREKLYLAEL